MLFTFIVVRLPIQPMSEVMEDSSPSPSLPPPSQDEQERMARLWALEESTSPKSWEDEQELDYTELAKKREMADDSLDTSKNSGKKIL